jgi:hypothetical protein
MRQRLARLAASLALLAALLTTPAARVMACSCAFLGYPEAIAEADVAFIGEVLEADEPILGGGLDAEARYVVAVERAKAPMTTPIEIASWFGDGASCGLDMNVGERWLVLATLEDGIPRTHLCHGSGRWDGMDAATRSDVELLLDTVPAARPADGGEILRVPLSVVVGGAAVLAVLAVSAVAFRRTR